MSEGNRIRRTILALIAISQVFSPVLFVPGTENFGGSVFRLILIVVSVALILSTGFTLVGEWARRALIAGSVLTAWMTISLTWSPELLSGLQEVSYVITILVLIYVIEVLIRDEQDLLSLGRWIVVLGGLITVASYYEWGTGHHFFHSSLQDIAETNRSLSYISDNLAWFTFDNPNDLTVHLAMCFFIAVPLLWGSKAGKAALFLFFVALAYLSDQLDARIVSASLVVFVILYAVARVQRTPFHNYATAMAMIGVILVGLVLALKYINSTELLDESTFIRLQLVKIGFILGSHTLFLGIGSGSFETELWSGGYLGETYGIINPHNAFSRMFAENGILGLMALGYLVIGPILVLPRATRVSALTAFTAAASIGLVSLFSVGSNPLSSSSLQLAIAYLWVACRFMTNSDVAAHKSVASPINKGARDFEIRNSVR